jgi:hypothetical protein
MGRDTSEYPAGPCSLCGAEIPLVTWTDRLHCICDGCLDALLPVYFPAAKPCQPTGAISGDFDHDQNGANSQQCDTQTLDRARLKP